VISSAVLLGVGLGGFVDGILLHQILQWHHLLSSRVPPVDVVSIEVNMLWDGLFHAFTWIVTAVGLGLLWRAVTDDAVIRSGRSLLGGLAVGWGTFNFVEGLVDHQLLGLHHVHPQGHVLAWDLGFLASGLVLVGLGLLAIREARQATPRVLRRRVAPETPGGAPVEDRV
jgi:uncharacterized membrane protein